MRSASAIATDDPPVWIQERFLAPEAAARWFRWTLRALPWRQDRVRMFGREHVCRRQTAFLAEGGARYGYSGVVHQGTGLGLRLDTLLMAVNTVLGTTFDSVLATRYRNGDDRLGWHADDEPELGPDPALAVLSLGAPRTLAFRTRESGAKRVRKRYTLISGTLLFMAPGTQRRWQHCVPQQRGAGERVSLGFRRLRWS